ncbi:hypothetical protein H0H93_001566, partial [Arthromyces matolae]
MPMLAPYQYGDAISAMGASFLRVRGKQFIGALLNLCAYFIFGNIYDINPGLLAKLIYPLVCIWIGLAFGLTIVAAVTVLLNSRADWKEE